MLLLGLGTLINSVLVQLLLNVLHDRAVVIHHHVPPESHIAEQYVDKDGECSEAHYLLAVPEGQLEPLGLQVGGRDD